MAQDTGVPLNYYAVFHCIQETIPKGTQFGVI